MLRPTATGEQRRDVTVYVSAGGVNLLTRGGRQETARVPTTMMTTSNVSRITTTGRTLCGGSASVFCVLRSFSDCQNNSFSSDILIHLREASPLAIPSAQGPVPHLKRIKADTRTEEQKNRRTKLKPSPQSEREHHSRTSHADTPFSAQTTTASHSLHSIHCSDVSTKADGLSVAKRDASEALIVGCVIGAPSDPRGVAWWAGASQSQCHNSGQSKDVQHGTDKSELRTPQPFSLRTLSKLLFILSLFLLSFFLLSSSVTSPSPFQPLSPLLLTKLPFSHLSPPSSFPLPLLSPFPLTLPLLPPLPPPLLSPFPSFHPAPLRRQAGDRGRQQEPRPINSAPRIPVFGLPASSRDAKPLGNCRHGPLLPSLSFPLFFAFVSRCFFL
ncbi:hypothetical protein C7M84_004084 [Penaeus vannamei]|uniref:Uncharacterized protein n=1 Tax=Penaeus vannamei TaxID=6689 RepID=A0A3R7N4T9_PENVA|nr:hypothetical protein C7M84_004084 [Penaeus vannamei]